MAEAFEAGAEGAEEVEEAGRFRACIYAPPIRIDEIHALLVAFASRESSSAESTSGETSVEPVESIAVVDWSQTWRRGLEAVWISSRLRIRPPFEESALVSGQREIVIDPGQAFGIGGHASTRLCLEWIDELIAASASSEGPVRFARVLDVGTGSGVLALAAVVLGAERAIGFDLDSVATRAAEDAAIRNGLTAKSHFFTGPMEALAEDVAGFDLVVANLLKCEMLPLVARMASALSEGGRLVLAGLLLADVAEVAERFREQGLIEVGRRSLEDDTGEWIGLCLAFEKGQRLA
ncbi:MAG: 50S ribosomal protein L11 methyltransferase [Myxococcota bacterium]